MEINTKLEGQEAGRVSWSEEARCEMRRANEGGREK